MTVSAARARRIAAAGALSFAVTASPAPAQDGGGSFVVPFSSLYLTTGTLLMDVSRLNVRFSRPDLLLLVPPQRTGFEAISSDGYSIGIGGSAPVGRVLLGGEWHYSDLGEESSTAAKTNRLETTYAMATVGYAAWTGWRFTLFPFLGVGAGSLTLTLRSRSTVTPPSLPLDPTFDEIVLGGADESRITGTYVMVQPGVGFDYLALRSNEQHVGIVLGVRFSSAITPNRTTWKYAGRSVFGAPDTAPKGAMLRLVFGIGGFKLAR